MLTALAIFGASALAAGGAFLASYVAEEGLPLDLAGMLAPRLVPVPVAVPPAPLWR